MGSGLEFIQYLRSPSDMVRSIRIEFAGALYHVTSRGDRREPIHEDDADRECFVKVLSQVAKNFNRGPVEATSFLAVTNLMALSGETMHGRQIKWPPRTAHRLLRSRPLPGHPKK